MRQVAVKDLSEAMSAAVLVAKQIARLKASKGWADEAEVHRYGRSDDAGRQAGSLDASWNWSHLPCYLQVVWDKCAVGAVVAT